MTTLAPSAAAPAIAAKDEARRFFMALYQGGLKAGEWFELRCLDCSIEPARPGPREFYRSITQLVDAAISHRDRWDVFYGVGLRRCPEGHSMRQCHCNERGNGPSSKLDHISRLPALWVDLDVVSPDEPAKRYPTLLDGQEALEDLNDPPKVVVCSGAGLHAYWPLRELTTDLERVVGINASIAMSLEVDNCGDAPRILRVPGTYNRKHGRPLPVQLIRPEPGGVG